MSDWEYMLRVFCPETPHSHEDLRKGFRSRKNIDTVIQAKKNLDAFGRENGCRWTLSTIRTPNFSPQQLHQELRHQGYDVLIIDYLNFLHMGKRELWENIYASTKYIKTMAADLNILVYLVAQLNDDEHAKYGRAAEEDANAWIHWTMYPGNPEVHFFHGKARNTPPFSFDLIFDTRKMEFVDPSCCSEKRMDRIRKEAETLAEEIASRKALRNSERSRVEGPKEKKNDYRGKGRRY
jgi:hypothetical protein